MAMGRVNRPTYGGSIAAGCGAKPRNSKLMSFPPSSLRPVPQQRNRRGRALRHHPQRHPCLGEPGWRQLYTANTMASVIEVMGLTLPAPPTQQPPAKQLEVQAAGPAILNLLKEDVRPSDILNSPSLRERHGPRQHHRRQHKRRVFRHRPPAGIDLTIDDFQAAPDRTPFLADLKPSWQYVFNDLLRHRRRARTHQTLPAKAPRRQRITVTGKTLAQNVENGPRLPGEPGYRSARPNPIKPTGHIQILRGACSRRRAPWAKSRVKKAWSSTGKARCFDAEDDFIAALEANTFTKGEKVVVIIRYEGPKGGPDAGNAQTFPPRSWAPGYNGVALITDGRFSGGSHGARSAKDAGGAGWGPIEAVEGWGQ